MAQNSKIEWCDHTVNLWWGCTEVHAGCDNCYARTLAHRRKPHLNLWGRDAARLMIKSAFSDLAKYQRRGNAKGEVYKIFINSMSDIFEKDGGSLINDKGEMITDDIHVYPTWISALRDQLFEEISEGKYPNLLFLLLTKRPSNINKYIPEEWKTNPPENVMFGTSPVDQKTFDTLVPQLYKVQGKRFLSIEPMLDEIDITKEYPVGKGQVAMGLLMNWIIVGGESGQKKRPFNADWARKIREDCKIMPTPFFMKQIDKVQEIPDDLMIREFPKPINTQSWESEKRNQN